MSTVARSLRTLVICLLGALCALSAPRLARAQSAVDGFNPGTNGTVYALATQPDGNILVGGSFSLIGGGGTGNTPRNFIARLRPDGTVDPSFNPGANGAVYSIVLQPDGRILVAGAFTTLGGGGLGQTSAFRIGRLNADGTRDSTFVAGANWDVYALALDADGRVMAGGAFAAVGSNGNQIGANRLARFESDGSIDNSFYSHTDFPVRAIAIGADGGIVIGGDFTAAGNGWDTPRQHLARLLHSGVLDPGFDPGVNGTVLALAIEADGQIVLGGAFSSVGGGGSGNVPRTRLARLNADGSLDASFDAGADGTVRALALRADGSIVVAGDFGALDNGGASVSRSRIGLLRHTGVIEPSFVSGASASIHAVDARADGTIVAGGAFTTLGGDDGRAVRTRNNLGLIGPLGFVDADFNPGMNRRIFALAVQPDGKILVGGDFSTLGGGGTGTVARSNIGRLNPDGTIDTTFNPGASDYVFALSVLPDGKILVGGQFGMIGGGGTGSVARPRLARLNPDGTVDNTFAPNVLGLVDAMTIQPDGRIIIGTSVTEGSVTRNRISRLFPDGALDLSFNQGQALQYPDGGILYTLALEPDGQVLVGGYFQKLVGQAGPTPRAYIGRVNGDGTLDENFNPGASLSVFSLKAQPDGGIIAAGGFQQIGGGGTGSVARRYMARLLPDGTVDPAFDPGLYGGGRFLLQRDGGIVSEVYGAPTRTGLVRLTANAAVDPAFNPGASSGPRAFAVQPDGKLIVAGEFTTLGGGGAGVSARSGIGRLTSSGPALQGLSVSADGDTIDWAFSGTAPELWPVFFEWSLDGENWTSLGQATRTASGWGMTGVTLPSSLTSFVRARGYYMGADGNASRSMYESVRMVWINPAVSPPTFNYGPNPATVFEGATVVFSADASGLPMPSLRWQMSSDRGATWTDVPESSLYTGAGSRHLSVNGVTQAMNGQRFRAVATSAQGVAVGFSVALLVQQPAHTELVSNGAFTSGTSGWSLYATPHQSYIQAQVTDGVFEFYRTPPPSGSSNQATIFRQTNVSVPSGAPLVATFDLGNSSSVRKRISVLVLDSDFSDLAVCTFWLPANAPLTPYVMRTHATKAWTSAAIYFYAATPGSDGGYYRLDNVSLQHDPDSAAQQTTCVDPNAPGAGAGSDGPNLLTNGDFSSGALSPGWGTFGTITTLVTNGVAQFMRPTNVPPAGVLLQATGQAMTAGEILTASLQLGTATGSRKRVTVILHDNNFTDLAACTFWLPPGAPLSTYTVRTWTTQSWTNATLSIYPATTNAEWAEIDNVSLQRTPGATITGTECLEPGAATRPAGLRAQADGPAEPGHYDTRRAVTPEYDGAQRPAGGLGGRLSGLDLESGDGYLRADGTLVLTAHDSDDVVVRLAEPIDLLDATEARLEFLSRLERDASHGTVQVHDGDGAWVTVATVSAGPLEWHSLDLSAFAGQEIDVRFVFHAGAGEPGDAWELSDVRVVR